MLEYSIVENPQREHWDSFLATNSLGNWWQTIDYGEFTKQMHPHVRTLRLTAVREGVLEGVVQGIFSKYLGFGTVMSIREGPILSATSGDKPGLLRSIIPALENLGAKNRVMRIKIWWPYEWGYSDLFGDLGYELVGNNTTYTIDLSKGAEALWRRISGNKRKNVKKALDRGVEFIETSNFDSIEVFYGLMLEVAKRDNFVPAPLSWFQTIWKSRGQKDLSKVFLARWGGNNVSGVFATIHSKIIYALGFGYLSTALAVRPNDLLHWKIMERGCKNGFLRYHMGDANPEQGASALGVWRWKREWNGDLNPSHIFSKSISKYPIIGRIYDRLKK
ncbi:peptidoglycan bridge formation glycyltransferase FemA/FemB family protein [Candidatus Bathyarchaeota archaeon]|nr:peptidoglycan bridge formation glycyltransferase FemA/FemB family protein [Candidatus Bathyarchaeota archaeon]